MSVKGFKGGIQSNSHAADLQALWEEKQVLDKETEETEETWKPAIDKEKGFKLALKAVAKLKENTKC